MKTERIKRMARTAYTKTFRILTRDEIVAAAYGGAETAPHSFRTGDPTAREVLPTVETARQATKAVS